MRTLIWWGHYITITLHVHGNVNDQFIEHISNKHSDLVNAGFKIQTKGEKWSNEIKNYVDLPESGKHLKLLLQRLINEKGVFRLGQFRKLSELNDLIINSETATTVLFH